MPDPVRVALIGCGGISNAHLAGFKALTDLGCVAVCCDVDLERAQARAAQVPDRPAEASSDIEAVLARDDIDAVDLCLPHDLHAEVAVAAARAGKHILCEKPIARDLGEADAMIGAADRAGVRLMVAHCQRFSADRQTAKRLVDEGAIGEVYLMRTDHNQWVDYPAGHWINDPAKLGGGAVAGSGVHHLDILRWFCGEVKLVSAGYNRNGLTARTAEDAGLIVFEHENGAVSEATVVWSVQRFPWYESFWIYGTKGILHNVGGLQIFDGRPREGEFRPVPTDHDDKGGFREEVRHFLTCVRDDLRPLMDGREARAALELVLACEQSAARGQKIALPLAGSGTA